MIKIHAVQAHEGDSLLLEHKESRSKRYVLVDGGPRNTFDPHLEATLKNKVAKHGKGLDLVVLSHFDSDHVTGLLDLFVELRSAVDHGQQPILQIEELWHNTFGLLDTDGTIGPRYASLMGSLQALLSTTHKPRPGKQRRVVHLANLALASIQQGERLGREAKLLKVPTNKRFRGKPLVATGDGRRDTRTIHGLKLRVVGPTNANLDNLRKTWKDWLKQQEESIRHGQLDLTAMADKSVPNLGSIQLLVEKEGKTALLTGDGRGDHLIEALEEAGLADASGMDVDLLKVPHHGSDRNVTKDFFQKVRAKTYLISANGKHGNPDYPTLKWIVDSANERGQRITIASTNETPSIQKLRQERPEQTHKYKVKLRNPSRHSMSVTV